jgi:DNA-binding transcriptional LysR family regulator
VQLIGSLRAVRALCEVDATDSFSAAAEALGLTQSAVSQHIAALERQLGLPLVERGTRPVGLTAAGHSLVRHGRAVLARLDQAEQELGEIAGRRAGRLRVGSFPTALTTFVPAALAALQKAHPSLTLTVVDDHMQRLLPRLTDRELDLALLYDHPSRPAFTDASLTRTHLCDDVYRAVLPQAHPLARRRAAPSLTDLAGEPWIGGSTDSAWFGIVRQSCRASGFDPRVTLRTDDYLAVQAFSAAGLGVAVVPGLAAARPLPGVVVRPLRATVPAPVRRIWAVHLEASFPSAAITSLIVILQEATRPRRARRRPGPGAGATATSRPAAGPG